MNLQMLVAHCVRELNNFSRGEPYSDSYGVELLRRAIGQGDQEAQMWVQHCFKEVILNWLQHRTNRWNSVYLPLPCNTCERLHLVQFWIRYGDAHGQEKSR